MNSLIGFACIPIPPERRKADTALLSRFADRAVGAACRVLPPPNSYEGNMTIAQSRLSPKEGDTKPCPQCRDVLIFNNRYAVLSVGSGCSALPRPVGSITSVRGYAATIAVIIENCWTRSEASRVLLPLELAISTHPWPGQCIARPTHEILLSA